VCGRRSDINGILTNESTGCKATYGGEKPVNIRDVYSRRAPVTGDIMFAKVDIAIISTLMLSASLPAAAQDIDLDQLPCGQFLESDPTAAKGIMFWLAGYYTYADDLAIINAGKMQDQEQRLKQLCSENKAMSVLTASGMIMDKMYKEPSTGAGELEEHR
jgi:hypothetical protein